MSIFYLFFLIQFAFRPSQRYFSWHSDGTLPLSVFVGAHSLCGDIFPLGALAERTALRGSDHQHDHSRYPDGSRLDSRPSGENKNVGVLHFANRWYVCTRQTYQIDNFTECLKCIRADFHVRSWRSWWWGGGGVTAVGVGHHCTVGVKLTPCFPLFVAILDRTA